jgi:hypothetical protein
VKTEKEDRESHQKRQAIAVRARIDAVKKAVCEQMYTDDYEEARALAMKMRHEVHVRNLEDERYEIDFLNQRLSQLEAKL